MIRVALADDHTIFREGLISLLDEAQEIEVVGEAENGKQVFVLLKKQEVDVLLLDIEMPGMDGFDTMRALRLLQKVPKVLVLTMHKTPQFVKNILKAGAAGYLPKDAGKELLVEAITAVHNTGSFHTEETAKMVIDSLKTDHISEQISPREREIIQLIADQHTTAEIAEKLFISKHTVESHRKNILLKLGLKNSAGLVKYAIQKGLI